MACLTCVKGLVCKFNFDSADSLRRLLRITRHVEHFVDMVEPAVLLAVRSEAIGTELAYLPCALLKPAIGYGKRTLGDPH
jgi:hypothetical protein